MIVVFLAILHLAREQLVLLEQMENFSDIMVKTWSSKSMEPLEHKRASLEALLFIHGEPLSYKKIGTVLGIPPDELAAFVENYKTELEGSGSGIAACFGQRKSAARHKTRVQ